MRYKVCVVALNVAAGVENEIRIRKPTTKSNISPFTYIICILAKEWMFVGGNQSHPEEVRLLTWQEPEKLLRNRIIRFHKFHGDF